MPGTHCELEDQYNFCSSDDDCGAVEVCDDNSCKRGYCTAGCDTDADCPSGSACFDGVCHRDQGVCTTDADCPPGIPCWGVPSVAASPDSDVDGVPDHFDNCPFTPNTAQTDADGDHVGDLCDLATCGNGVTESPDEACDGLHDAACPGQCQPGCACPAACPNVMPASPGTVVVKTRREAGKLRVRLVLDLGTYAGEPVGVQLDDTNPGTIAETTVPLAERSPGKSWRFRSRDPGVQSVRLRKRSRGHPGEYSLSVKAKHWFAASAATRPAADTSVTITIGTQCFTHVATKKVD